MAWWKRSEPAKRETKSRVLGLSDDLGAFLMFGEKHNANTATSALALYEQSTAVSVPINIVVDAFKVLEPALKIGQEIILEHEVLDLLKRPSPFYTRELFFETLGKDYLITGENLTVALGPVNREPIQLQPISPRHATPVRQEMSDVASSWQIAGVTLPGQYNATPSINALNPRYLDGGLKELKHVRNYSTRNNALLRGQSLLLPASQEARAHILGTGHNVSILEQGGRVSLVFIVEEDLDTDDFEETKERIRQQYGGATKAGTVGVIAGSKMEIQELGVRPKDMDFANLQAMAKKAVALQFRVPLPLISDERMTLGNYKEGKLALYDDAVLPLAAVVLGGLSDFLLPRFGLDPRKTRIVANTDSVTALVMRRNEELFKRSQINIETDNELREMIGREGYEGGNVVLKAANLIPAGTDLFTADEDPNRIEEPADLGGAARDQD